MSLSIDGVWKAGVWAQTVWADGVWREGDYVAPVLTAPGVGKARVKGSSRRRLVSGSPRV